MLYQINKNGPSSILELAAGPARHSLTALSSPNSISNCHAVDLSTDMKAYAKEIAEEFLPDADDPSFQYSIMDMSNLDATKIDVDDDVDVSEESIDSAWMLLGSMQHLLTNSDAISTFQSIGSVVKTGGTLIIELPHPRELFQLMECTRNGWEIPLDLDGEEGSDEGELRVIWGDDEDVFDPILQQRQFTVELKLVGKDKNGNEEVMQKVREVVPMRLFTAQELDALASASGCWQVEKMYGALDEEIEVGDDDLAFRMVCVLRKI